MALARFRDRLPWMTRKHVRHRRRYTVPPVAGEFVLDGDEIYHRPGTGKRSAWWGCGWVRAPVCEERRASRPSVGRLRHWPQGSTI